MPISTAVLIMSLFAQTPGGSARLAGRVTDAATQAPIAGARVTVMQIAETEHRTYGGTPLASLTDEQGRFAFDGLAEGAFQMEATKNGFASSREPMVSQTIHLYSGKTMTFDIALKKGAVLTGRVVDARGEPLADMTIMVLRTVSDQPDQFPFMQGNNRTNDLGEFRVANLPEGPFVLMATPPGHEPFAGQVGDTTVLAPTYYPATTDRKAAQTVQARSGETSTGLEITMARSRAFAMSGIVVSADGKPAGGAMIMILPEIRELMSLAHSPSMASAQPDGTFRVSGLLPGDYRVSATAGDSGGGSFGGGTFGSFEINSLTGEIGAVTSVSGDEHSFDSPGIRVNLRDADVAGLRIVAKPGR